MTDLPFDDVGHVHPSLVGGLTMAPVVASACGPRVVPPPVDGRDHDWMSSLAAEAGFASSTEITQGQYEAFERAMRDAADSEDRPADA